MAKAVINVEQNENLLWDYELTVNGEVIERDDNYTTEEYAEEFARKALQDWLDKRFG